MTFNPQTVDVVSLSPDGTTVELHVVREKPWTGAADELASFQAKVQTYVGYAMDGQLHTDYPETAGLPWTIVVTSYDGGPDEHALYVMSALQERLPAYGGSLVHRVK